MASFKDICPFAPAIPPSSVNTGVRRPPGRLFLSVELKNQILQNMKYLSPQKFSWGDAPWQIIVNEPPRESWRLNSLRKR
ncbi:T3SS secreted effector IpaH [Escherichia coli O145:H28]|nr:T3SS secreted effector IpaH [Escherichia coli O145:H28]